MAGWNFARSKGTKPDVVVLVALGSTVVADVICSGSVVVVVVTSSFVVVVAVSFKEDVLVTVKFCVGPVVEDVFGDDVVSVLEEFAKVVAITTTTINTIRMATNTPIVANQPVHAFFFFVCSLAFVSSIAMAITEPDAPA